MKSISVAILLMSEIIFAQETSSALSALSAKDLFQKYSPAVVKIITFQQGVAVSEGTGFFISQDGILVTNRHVIKSIFQAGFGLTFQLKNGNNIKDYLFGGCGDFRKIDLCFLKLKIKPIVWFEFYKSEIPVGEKIFVIGHPQGYDFSMSEGIVSGVRKISANMQLIGEEESPHPEAIEEIQVSAPISSGNSGGPIFNSHGKVIAVATWHRVDKGSQNLNFGISSLELQKAFKAVLSLKPSFVPLKEVVKANKAINQATTDKILSQYLDPAYKLLDRGLPLDKKFFGVLEFEALGKKYEAQLPKAFLEKNCALIEKNDSGYLFRCDDLSYKQGYVSIGVVKMSENSLIKNIQNRWAQKSGFFAKTPLPIVQNYIARGSWDDYKKRLSPGQIKYLFSFASNLKCKNILKSDFYLNRSSTQCSFSVYNDGESNLTTSYSISQKNNEPFAFIVTGSAYDPTVAGLYFHSKAIAFLTLKPRLK